MTSWITDLIEGGGYVGIFFLMILENVFPPIPSEVIMLTAGVTAAAGGMSLLLATLSGTAGSVIGLSLWYLAARAFGEARIKRFADSNYGRFLTLSREEIDNGTAWFQKYGSAAVFFGRCIPTIRTLISVPAGVARMHTGKFLLYSTLGSLIWIGGLACTGFYFGRQFAELVEQYLDIVSNVVIAALVILYFYRVITFKSDAQKNGYAE